MYHYKLLFNQTLIGTGHLNLNLGYQIIDVESLGFEFHNQPEIDLANTLALGLDLRTFSGNHIRNTAKEGGSIHMALPRASAESALWMGISLA